MWGQTAVVGTELWSEPFKGTETSTTFTATSSWGNYINPTTFVAADASSLSYSSSKAMLSSTTSTNMSGAHVWLNKSVDGYIQVTGIPLYNATKVKVSWAQATSGSSTTVYYQFDGTGDFSSLSTCSAPNSNFESDVLSVANHTTIALKFFHPSSNAKNTRIDNLKLVVTEIASQSGTTAAPTISGNTPFLDNTEVTITNAASADGADIFYTLNDDDPTTTASATCFAYSTPFSVSATTTVKAIAKKSTDTNSSSVVSKTFTKVTPITVSAALTAINDLESNGTIADQCVSGIVCTAGSLSSGTITYYVSADGTANNRLQVYKGKGLNNANFEAAGDIAVGDEVVVYGTLKNYNGITPEFDQGNYLLSKVRKTASDLAITSSSPIALEMTTASPSPTSTITWTTSSTGAMSFASDATSVATVSDAGIITAVGAGTAKITISQAADANYQVSGDLEVTVTVTDNRDVCATGIDLTSAKTITKEDVDNLAATCTLTDGFTGSVTYSYITNDPDIFYITGTEYMGAGVGTTTVMITATPTGGNAANYKVATQEVAVTVNGTNSISLNPTSKTVAFSASTFDIAATVPTDNYNGTISAVSDNEYVATVSVDGTTVTVTPVAVGSAKITVTAGTDTYYPVEASAECNVEFTMPVGSETAPPAAVTTTFKDKNLNYDEGGIDWTASIDANSFESSSPSRGVQFGAAKGEFTLTAINNDAISKVSMVLSTNGTGNTVSVKVGNSDFTTTYGVNEGDDAIKSLTLTNGMSKETLEFTGNGTGNVVISVNDANKSVYFKSITLTKASLGPKVTLNGSGYATFCSQYPLDFTNASGFSAWQITSIENDVITFSQITGSVKGGTGILLKGTADETVTINSSSSTNELSGNKLVGTLAPTYVEDDTYYGLSGEYFKKVSAGKVPAGKALLPASVVDGSNARLTFVFEDAQGIKTIEHSPLTSDDAVYNLNGQRVDSPKKGLYIVNGKKVVMK